MEKTYILLRSNKQQGPYTLAQLTKMNLQKDDLIHVQHGVAGWQYAEEIEVLKPYFSTYTTPSVPVVDAETPLPVSTPKVSTIKKEPVAKAASVFASFPEGTQPSPSGLELQSSSSSFVHAARPRTRRGVEERNEPLPLAAPVPQQTELLVAPIKAPILKTQHARNRKPVAVGLSLLALAALAFGINQFATSGAEGNPAQSGQEKADLGAGTASSNSVVPDNKVALQQELPLTDTKQETAAPIPAREEQPDNRNLPTTNQPEKSNAALTPDSGQDAAEVVALPKAKELPKEPEAAAPKATPDLTEQIYLKSNFTTNELGEGVYDLAVSLDNKSDKLLKTVAVNVVFTDNDGKTLNRQTIYFSNVKPGETMVRSASQHKLAKRVRCELGLVSSEGLLFYSN